MNFEFFTRLFNKVVLGNWGTMYGVLRGIAIVTQSYDELKTLKNNDGVITLDALIDWAEPKLKNELFRGYDSLGAVITNVFNLFESVKALKQIKDETADKTG